MPPQNSKNKRKKASSAKQAPTRRNIDIPLDGDARTTSQASTRSRIDIPLDGDTRPSPPPTRQNAAKRPPQNRAPAQPKRAQSSSPANPPRTSRSEARKRRRRRNMVTTGIFLVAVLVGFVLSVTVLFPIKSFRVDGDTIYTEEEFITAFGHTEGENIFRFSMTKSEDIMMQNLPYLESIKIRRSLPSTVVFIAEPAVETYYIQTETQIIVLSANFKVLRIADTPPENTCRIIGAEDIAVGTPGNMLKLTSEDTGALLETVVSHLKTWLPAGVTYIDISSPLEITLIYENRFLVKLGTVNNIDYKLEMLSATLNTQIGAEEAGSLDASYVGKVFYAAGAPPALPTSPQAEVEETPPAEGEGEAETPENTEETPPE